MSSLYVVERTTQIEVVRTDEQQERPAVIGTITGVKTDVAIKPEPPLRQCRTAEHSEIISTSLCHVQKTEAETQRQTKRAGGKYTFNYYWQRLYLMLDKVYSAMVS